MTSTQPDLTPPAPGDDTPRPTARSIARAIVGDLRKASPGDLAQLRRGAAYSSVFWRLYTQHVDRHTTPRWLLDESRWLVATVILANGLRAGERGARATGIYSPRVHLGSALASAGFSEARLARLLRARDTQLASEAERAARMLAAKNQEADLVQLVELLFTRPDRTEPVRLGIARSYYRNSNSTSQGD